MPSSTKSKSRISDGSVAPGGLDTRRVCVYLTPREHENLRIQLIRKTGHGNISKWVRDQIRRFLGT